MKLVVKEYLLALKEDKELDSFLVELLISMSIIPVSKPQRGRQFGVDIYAVGIDPEDGIKKNFILTVKQGDLNRTNWDTTDPTSVRPSLVDIKDVFIKNHIPSCWSNLPVKVIVAVNGEKEPALQQNWVGFEKSYVDSQIQLFFWGIDEMMIMVEKFMMNELLLPKDEASLLRKALAFLDLPDYDLNHFYRLVKNLASGIEPGKKKPNKRKIRLINLCLNIFYQWCIQNDNIKPSIYAGERALLETWEQLRRHDLLNNYHLSEFFRLFNSKQEIDLNYFKKVHQNFYAQDGLSSSMPTHVEYSLITFEQIGIIATIGLFYFNLYELSTDPSIPQQLKDFYRDTTDTVAVGLAHLIAKNPSSLYPLYDEHCVEINLALLFFYKSGKHGDAIQWINDLHKYLVQNYKFAGFFPEFETNYERVVEVLTGQSEGRLTSSILYITLVEWALVFKSPELYKSLRHTYLNVFKDVNLQIWFPGKDIENSLYTGYAMHNVGSTKSSIRLPESHLEYEKEMLEELEMFSKEEADISAIKMNFPILVLWSNRHFRNYVLPVFWRSFLKQDERSDPT